jgi:hypothetical protein
MILMTLLIVLVAVFVGSALISCSSDDDTPVVDENNVLLIQSDNGITSRGMMYKSGEMYNPPHCYMGKSIVYNDDNPITVYYIGFGANIKGSDVFYMLNIKFESNKPMIFMDLKSGDTFDCSQFHASAAYTPTWPEAILRQTTALSGKVIVVGTSKVGDKSYLTLRLSNLRFNAIDNSCVYTVNGTVEYEIWE